MVIPSGVNAGKVKIKISGSGTDHILPNDLTVFGPTFTSFSPQIAVPGDVVTIKGENFNKNDLYVKFGTTVIYPFEVSASVVKVIVPSGIIPGPMRITVVSSGQSIIHDDYFTLKN